MLDRPHVEREEFELVGERELHSRGRDEPGFGEADRLAAHTDSERELLAGQAGVDAKSDQSEVRLASRLATRLARIGRCRHARDITGRFRTCQGANGSRSADDQAVDRYGDDAARFRAAIGWSGLSIDEIADALGISRRTVTRLTTGEAEIGYERKQAIAAACDVPMSFMEHGFGDEEPELAERVEALERQMRALWTTAQPAAEVPQPGDVVVSPSPLVAEPPARSRRRRAG